MMCDWVVARQMFQLGIYFLAMVYLRRMSKYGKALLVVAILVIVYLVITGSVMPPKMRRRKREGMVGADPDMSNGENRRTMDKLDTILSKENRSRLDPAFIGQESGSYDPIMMGALKKTEVDAHRQSLREMLPFTQTGPAAPERMIRDDDEKTRNTGIVWLGTGGGQNALRLLASGPQGGARQVPSTSMKDIQITHILAENMPQWGGIIGGPDSCW